MEEDEMTYGIDRLAELLAERGIEFCVGDHTSLVFMDGVGNLHECWMAGAEENLVNVCITITPEQALSVRDLNGIVSENAKLKKAMDFQALELGCMTDNRDILYLENEKLRSLVRQWYPHMLKRVGRDALEQWGQMDVVKELRIEV